MYWELKWVLCIKEYQVSIPRMMNSFTTPYLLHSFCAMGIGPGLCTCQISSATKSKPLLQESQIPRGDTDMKLLSEGIHKEGGLKNQYLYSYHRGC